VRSLRYLILWLTDACDLDCAYCYRGERSLGAMAPEVARAALALAARGTRPFHVQLAGGEPTLEPGLLERIVTTIRTEGLPATIALQTNGVGLDARLARLLREHRVEVGISLDGPPAVHDALRSRAGDTLRAIALLGSEGVEVRVTAVLSVSNAAHLGELALLLAGFPNVRGLALDPFVSRGADRTRIDLLCPPEPAARAARDLYAALHAVSRLRPSPLVWRELERVRHQLRSPTFRICDFCHACRGESAAVAPDGTVYPCSQVVGDPAYAAGTVTRVDGRALRAAFAGVQLSGPCGDCPLRGRCPGDCPSRVSA